MAVRSVSSYLFTFMMQTYLAKVQSGALPLNNQIVYNLQDIFNLLPNLNAEVSNTHRVL